MSEKEHKIDDAVLDEFESAAGQNRLKEEERKIQQERAEFNRERAEKNKRMEEHRQRVQALEEAEYKAFDLDRAKCADALMWLDFETKTRNLINQLVQPALQLSIEDREQNIELEIENRRMQQRLQLLEEAVFQEKKYSRSHTIFDSYNEKLESMQKQITEETLRLHDTQAAHKDEIDGRLFAMD